MARNKYSRRLFPIKAYVVSKERPYPKVHYEEMPNLNIGKLKLPAIGYVHIRFKDIVDEQNTRKIVICVGTSIVPPDQYCNIIVDRVKNMAKSLSHIFTLDEGFHEARYAIVPMSARNYAYKFNPYWKHWYELMFVGDPKTVSTTPFGLGVLRKIESDCDPKPTEIITKLKFDFKYRHFRDSKMCGEKHSYILPVPLSDQIYYYINRCLTDYIKRHYKRNIRHVDQH